MTQGSKTPSNRMHPVRKAVLYFNSLIGTFDSATRRLLLQWLYLIKALVTVSGFSFEEGSCAFSFCPFILVSFLWWLAEDMACCEMAGVYL